MRSAVRNVIHIGLRLIILVGVLVCSMSQTAFSQSESVTHNDQILTLYDAFGPEVDGVVQDFGFSALIRYQGKLILFDAGTNAEIFAQNVKALGVDLRDIDFAVASHSHFDHISGFDYLLEVNPDVIIYFPNDPFWGAPLPFDVSGTDANAAKDLPVDQQYFRGEKTKFTFRSSGRFRNANVKFIDAHTEIAPGINLIATRSPFMGYFSRYPNTGATENVVSEKDIKTMGLPELSLSLSTPDGEVLVVGCSHSLVDVITRTARDHLNHDIAMVMGGYHLLPYNEDEISEMARRMHEELGVARVAPAHCTGHLGFKLFGEIYGDNYVPAGLGRVIDLQ
jgi:7,8-dihydropterin-6-yl-methyl-4-(beta-D-ribofuranosyl)aminobenzene 5'-phosphate synthase